MSPNLAIMVEYAGDLPTLCPWGRGLRCLCWLGRPFARSATCPICDGSAIAMKYRRCDSFAILITNHMYFFVLELWLWHTWAKERSKLFKSNWHGLNFCKYQGTKRLTIWRCFIAVTRFWTEKSSGRCCRCLSLELVEGGLRYFCCPLDCKATSWCAQIHCVRAKFEDLCWFGGGKTRHNSNGDVYWTP